MTRVHLWDGAATIARDGSTAEPMPTWRLSFEPGADRACVAKFDLHSWDLHDQQWHREGYGSVKWDGCSDWTLGDRCMWHMCDPNGGDTIAALVRSAYLFAAEQLGESCDYDPPDESACYRRVEPMPAQVEP